MGNDKSNKRAKGNLSSRKGVHFEALEPRILFDASAGGAPTAEVSVSTGELTANEDQLLNDNIEFNLTFDNNGGQEGYVPYIDFLALPEMVIENVTGFGGDLENPTGPATEPIGVIAGDGQLIDINSGLPINHPMYETSIGTPSSNFIGGAGSGTEPVTYDPSLAGYYLYSVELPFGSYTPGNPPAEITVEASLNDADGIVPSTEYDFVARGAFALGCDALDNPGTVAAPDDEPVFGGFDTATAIPQVISLTKSASVAEDEGAFTGENASGPNHPVTYSLNIDIAEGETINNLRLTDVLPPNLAYLGNLTVTGATLTGIVTEPQLSNNDIDGVPASDNLLDLSFAPVTGAAGNDIVITYDAFVAYVEDGGDLVIDPVTGEENDDDYNDAAVTGDWTDDLSNTFTVSDNAGALIPGIDPDGAISDRETDYQIDEHSLAIQKGVSFAPDGGGGLGGGDRAASGWSEGDIAEFTMNFQVSDYFAFGTLMVTDTMGDGLEFLPAEAGLNAAGFDTDPLEIRPVLNFTMHVNGVQQDISVDFDAANITAVENLDGTTTITFDVYQQLVDSNFINPGDALTGGLVPTNGLGVDPMGSFNSGIATAGSITYRAKVRNDYATALGNTEINQGDTLTNSVVIEGENLNVNDLTTTNVDVTDGSGTSIQIVTGTVTKELFSATRNGDQRLAANLDGGLEVVPGDVITWRIVYELPITEFEGLSITDYLPLPVFDASEIDLTQVYDYDPTGYLTGGRISFGPNDSFIGPDGTDTTGDGGIDDDPAYDTPNAPTLSLDAANNAFTVTFGDYDIPESEDPIATTIELFVSTTITDGVYAEGLRFTNQVGTTESDSFNATVASNEIAQINLGVPDLEITKGVLAVDSTSVVTYTGSGGPLGVNFNPPGSAEAFDTSTGDPIISDSLDDDPDTVAVDDPAPIDRDIEDADAGDVVTFGITVQNRGSADFGAFDVQISDTLPGGFEVPSTLAEFNLRVTDGNGTAIDYDVLDSVGDVIGSSVGGTLTPALGSSESDVIAAFFAGSIELVDPDDNTGALAEYDGTSGENLVLIAYDLVIDDTAGLGSELVNTATVQNFSYRNGGPNYAEPEDTDTATVTIERPTVVKEVVETSHVTTSNEEVDPTPAPADPTGRADDNLAEVAIGEVVTYTVTIDIPEGTLENVIIQDNIQPGMAFVGVDSISFDSGLTTSKGVGDFSDVDVYYDSDLSRIRLGVGGTAGLGTIVNSDTDNTVPEQVTFTYKAVVLNDAVNQAGVIRSNDAEIRWQTGGSNLVEDDSVNVRVVEPNISVSKSLRNTPTTVEGADTVTYRIVVRNNDSAGNTSEGYDVELSDFLPDDVTFISASYVNGANGLAPDVAITYNAGSGSNGELTASWDTFDVGSIARFDVVVQVNDALLTDTVITNTANVEYTSLPGELGDAGHNGYDPATDSGSFSTPPVPGPLDPDPLGVAFERTGNPGDPGGSANDYNRQNSASVTVINPVGIDKVVIETSEDHTAEETTAAGDVEVAIGEVVRYEVRIRVPQANSTDLELVDVLGAGLEWIPAASNDIQFRLEGFNPDGSTISASGFTAPQLSAALAGSTDFPDGNVSFSAASNTVTFDFGDIINTETDAADEYIYISYNAIVQNKDPNDVSDPGVTRGATLRNTVQLREGGANIGSPLTQDITVVEPDLTIAKSDNGTTTADAGDVIDYTLTITAGTSNPQFHTTAFDLLISDTLPDQLDLVGGTVAFVGLPGTSTGNIVENTVADSFTATVDRLEPGETFQITFQGTVRDTGANIIEADETVTNTASLTYSTLPGDGTDATTNGGTVGNETGNEAGTPGDTDGERITTRSNSDSFSSPAPVLSKFLANPADTTFTIGETVEYVITLQVPEGELGDPEAFIIDTIDSGFRYVPGTLTVNTSPGIDVGVAGTLNEANTDFFTFSDPGNTALEEELRFDFDQIIFNDASAGDGLANGTIEIRYELQVENILANQQGDQLNNEADFFYTDEDGTTRRTVQDTTGDNDTIITVVEPQVNTAKRTTSVPPTPESGETISYEVTLTNPGGPTNALQNVTAFDVTAQDVLPTNLDLSTGTFTATSSVSGDVSGSFTVTADGWSLLPAAGLDLVAGEVITITYDAIIQEEVLDGEALTNEVDTEWTSINGTALGNGVNGERTGDSDLSDDPAPGSLNNYESDAEVTVFADFPNNLTKRVLATSSAATGDTAGTDNSIEDLVVGETVTYEIIATLGRGTNLNVRIIDQLSTANGLLDITNVQIFPGSNLSLASGDISTVAATISDSLTGGDVAGTDSYNDRFVADFGTVINDATGVRTANETIRFVVTATLVNDLANQQGDVIENTATLEYRDDPNQDGTFTIEEISDSVDVEIVEPQIDAAKTITNLPSPVQAGETVSYRVTLTHPGGVANQEQNVTAFDLSAQDTLPADLTFDQTSFSATLGGSNIAGSFVFNTDGWTLPASAGIDLLPGQQIIITYDATIDVEVKDGDVLTNTVDVDWTSLDGADANERGGFSDLDTDNPGGDPNDYEDSASADTNVNLTPTFDFEKRIISTSVSDTGTAGGTDSGITDLVIGETVTYELVATLPRGTVDNVRIIDQLALANGLLDITNVQISAGSALTLPGGAALTTVTPSVIDSATADGYDDRVVFNFGTVINTPPVTPVAGDDQIVVTITALVVNDIANQQGDVITNTGELRYFDDANGNGTRTEQVIQSSVNVEIVEPQVDTNKRVTTPPATLEAGVTVPYEVTLTNSSDVTAFDLTARDVLPADLVLQTGTFSAILNPSGAATDISSLFDRSATGWQIQTGADIDLAPGDVIRITYDTIIAVTVNDQDLLTNEVDTEWTSIDGANANERGGDGDLDTESDPVNDYESGDTVTIQTDFEPIITKRVLSTTANGLNTADGTSSSIEDLVIGEGVTYEILVTLGRGTTENVRIFDQLEIANGLLDISTVQVFIGGALTPQGGGSLNTTPIITDSLGGTDGYRDTVDLVLGNVVNNATGSETPAEQIRILVTAAVLNVEENQQGDVINNNVDLFYTADPDADGNRTLESIRATASVEIVEPQVDVAKSTTSVPSPAEAGETISYRVTLTNPGGAGNLEQNVTAYEVTAQDVLPSGLELVPGSFDADLDGNDITSSFTQSETGWGLHASANIDLAPGEVITIIYDAVILDTVRDGELLTNEVDIEWTSLDGIVNTGDRGERGGDGDLDTTAGPTDPNDYEEGDNASVRADLTPVFEFEKQVLSTSAAHTDETGGTDVNIEDLVVGETVTYELVATMGRGTTDGVRIVDQLSIANGLLDITSVSISGGAALSLPSGTIGALTPTITDNLGTDTYRDRVEYNIGTVINDPALVTDTASEQIRVLITAVVVNDIENQDGDVIANTGTFFFQDDPDGDGTRSEQSIVRTADVEIVEPVVNTAKRITSLPLNPTAGERVEYEVVLSNPAPAGTENVIAFDVTSRDDLPDNLSLDNTTFEARINGALISNALFSLTADGWSIATPSAIDLNQGDRLVITYDAVIQPGVQDGENLLNEVDTEWTSLDGTVIGERSGNGDLDSETPAGQPNDYESADTADFDAEFTAAFAFDKSIVSTSENTGVAGGTDNGITDLVIGETVTYALTATLGRGTTDGVRIIDQLSTANGILDITNVQINPGSALSLESGAPFSSISPTITDSLLSDTYRDRIEIDFGTVVNDASATVVADEQIQILVTAIVVNIADNTAGDVIENTADFFYFDDPLGTGTQTEQSLRDRENVEILEPNLSITKAVNNDQPRLNEVLTYTLTVTNNAGVSATDAFDLVIDDLMDPRMTLDTGSINLIVNGAPANPSSIISNTSTANNLVLGIDRLDEGESIEITYEVRVSSDIADFDAVLPNDVDLYYSSIEGDDPNERGGDPDTNNPDDPDTYTDGDNESVEVFQPDLRIEKLDYDAEIVPGGLVTYEMTVTNQGRAEARTVTVTDDISHYLEAGFQFLTGTNATLTDGVVTFTLPDMPVNDVQVVTMTLQAPDVIPAGLESITNIAVANHEDIDPTPPDNEDPEETPVIAVPDLVVTKDDGLLLALTGDEITYVIEFTNVGDQVASGVIIEDILPPGMEFISATDGGILRGGSVFWEFDSLAPGEVRTVEVIAEVITPGLKLNTVTIKDDGRGGPDPTPENNRDIDTTDTERRFRYDLTQDFRTRDGNQTLHEHHWGSDRILRREPVILATYMASGLAQAGSTITLEVYDERGQLIADTSVVADAGGNWLASFPMADVEKQPARIEMKQTWASYNPAGERSYNFRTYFGPAFSTGTYYTEQLTVLSVMEKRNPTEVIDLYESSKMILAMDWNGQLYEFAARGALQSSSGN